VLEQNTQLWNEAVRKKRGLGRVETGSFVRAKLNDQTSEHQYNHYNHYNERANHVHERGFPYGRRASFFKPVLFHSEAERQKDLFKVIKKMKRLLPIQTTLH